MGGPASSVSRRRTESRGISKWNGPPRGRGEPIPPRPTRHRNATWEIVWTTSGGSYSLQLRLILGAGAAVLAATLLSGALSTSSATTGQGVVKSTPPQTMLWAWDMPEDLRFLRSSKVGVAFLAANLMLRDDSALIRLRRNPLRINPSTFPMAVVRVETDRRQRATLSETQRHRTGTLILEMVSTVKVKALQVDFDAARSEWRFYAGLLADLRSHLPADDFLSMTALTSWCGADSWLHHVPVDESVPMLFRMGADREAVLARVTHGGDFLAPECRGSLGLSTDEMRVMMGVKGRRYYFNPQPWSLTAIRLLGIEP